MTALHERTVRGCLDLAVADGWLIQAERRKGRPHEYVLAMPAGIDDARAMSAGPVPAPPLADHDQQVGQSAGGRPALPPPMCGRGAPEVRALCPVGAGVAPDELAFELDIKSSSPTQIDGDVHKTTHKPEDLNKNQGTAKSAERSISDVLKPSMFQDLIEGKP